ncbi:S46 family peptidase [Sphingobacterium thalpophilum]|uniref:Dipeptidyl-peptidase n=1 Tax=Sphingobacterium thalpophilum TaxID=259 RepID=A0A4U9VJM1_9SPHI|nr:S46 family peptidase [Sphingobacterium thalpophilum]VTR47320.1 V8-like Glu-specific endopeptidase [Sphingobacterium thalpophilum]
MKFINSTTIALALLLSAANMPYSKANPDEGMFPLSELHRAGLKKAGLKISEKDIYNPGNVGLVDALVQVSGCTGSFVSNKGLIITNHHCAFSAVQLASTAINNYLKNGFVAQSQEQEIEAKGLKIRITDSYEDVSNKILNAVANISDPVERINTIKRKQEELVRQAEKEDPTIKAEVSEMFIGKSYVLFRYKTIEDVRLVYIPRQNIGEFGGETDNWVWPRHTGDYSFLRAYVGKDGKSAPYSKDNVPYQPKKHLKVNPNGVKENDFTFILGYPGRTFRHRPAQYIRYQQEYLLPYVSNLYDFQNRQMEEAGKDNTDVALSLATRIKRNANVLKNYRGKLKGLRGIDLLSTKKQEDEALAAFISSKPELKDKYGNLLSDIDAYYQVSDQDALKELWINNIYSSTSLLRVARDLNAFKAALANERSPQSTKQLFEYNIESFKKNIKDIYASYNKQADQRIFGKMLEDAAAFQGKNQIASIQKLQLNPQMANNYATQAIDESKLADQNYILNSVLADANTLLQFNDKLLDVQNELDKDITTFAAEQKRREGVLNKLMGDYVAVKEIFQAKNFIPDANSTLRLTYGHIKGYSPADATYMKPFTTIEGIIQKGNLGLPEFDYPQEIKTAYLNKNFGPYLMKDLGSVPVNMLYDMDTTSGNSGSPIMNANGELIGVNFDRAYDATINDFAWNESYSRSIGVDIRYVLWVADKIDNAHFILKEMGV